METIDQHGLLLCKSQKKYILPINVLSNTKNLIYFDR